MQVRPSGAQGTLEPFELFETWFREADDHPDISDASAVNLATATAIGAPSSRMVLLKGHGPTGYIFYTNLRSRKAQELDSNARAALCFYWEPLGKQIRVEGISERVSDAEADEYFATRPLSSRIAAYASKQSARLESRAELLAGVARFSANLALREVRRPDFWSGFRINPTRFEFWTTGAFRLHDRMVFEKDGSGNWHHSLLYP